MTTKIFLKFSSWRPGTLAKNTILVTGGLLLRAFLQFLLFVGLARFLGVREYGKFIAVVAIMTFLVPLVGFGMPTLLIREMAIDRKRYSYQFGKSMIITVLFAMIYLPIAIIVSGWFLPEEISCGIIFNIALAELLFLPIIDLSRQPFKAIELFTYSTVFSTGLIFFRLAGFGLMLATSSQVNAECWSFYYLLATVMTMFCALAVVFREFGFPEFSFRNIFSAMREGCYFALSGMATRINGEIDKVFLARLSSLKITGGYSAAYRFTDIILLPVNALLGASGARFFRAGEKGIIGSSNFAKKILPIPVAYTIIGGLLLFFGAEFVPLLLGPGFVIAVPMLKWLAILPLLLMLRSFLSIIVVAGGHPRYNGMVFLFGAMSNIGLNACLIPHFGWAGAVLATIIAEIVMILFLCLKQ